MIGKGQAPIDMFFQPHKDGEPSPLFVVIQGCVKAEPLLLWFEDDMVKFQGLQTSENFEFEGREGQKIRLKFELI